MTTLRRYLMLALFMMLPSVAVDAQTADASRANKNALANPLPPIDQDLPKVFETASFGLG